MRKAPPFIVVLLAWLLAACGGEATALPIPTATPAPSTTPAPRDVYPAGEPGAAVIHEESGITVRLPPNSPPQKMAYSFSSL